jgi:hypothetical protein
VLPASSAVVLRVFAATAVSAAGASAPIAGSWLRWPFVSPAAGVPGLAFAEVSAFPALASRITSPESRAGRQPFPPIIRKIRVLPAHETRVDHVDSRLFLGITEKAIDLPLIGFLPKAKACRNFAAKTALFRTLKAVVGVV